MFSSSTVKCDLQTLFGAAHCFILAWLKDTTILDKNNQLRKEVDADYEKRNGEPPRALFQLPLRTLQTQGPCFRDNRLYVNVGEEHRAEVCPLPTAEHGPVCVSEASSCGPASARRHVHPFASKCLTSRQERREELIRYSLIRHVQLDDAISDWRFVFSHHSPTNVLILCLLFTG